MVEVEQDTSDKPSGKQAFRRRNWLVALVIGALLIIPLLYASYVYASSPETIRDPKLEHYHFRMQVLVDGKQEIFADAKYQQDYVKGACTIDLPEEPFHFHDSKDQLIHVHWDGMTGGMLMKYYGWNYIGGMDGVLGYRINDLKNIRAVSTHGNILPSVSDNLQFYIYTGDETEYKEKSFEDWKTQNLEQFFGKASSFAVQDQKDTRFSLLDILFPAAYAHDGENHPSSDELEESTEIDAEGLARINNLLGNVVIFVQESEPTEEQVKARFNNLEPLSDTTCGG